MGLVTSSLVVEIGDYPVRLSAADPHLLGSVRERYTGFVTETPSATPFNLTLQVVPNRISNTEAVHVTCSDGCWRFERDMFHAEWFPETGCGSVLQVGAYATSIDSVLRILHTLLLAPRGGFLLHAASAVRNGSAFVFSGVSGIGKTTISRLAPPDVTLLTDEMSYIRPRGDGYQAFGTPFAGDLGRNGANISAPLKEIHMLARGSRNKRELLPPSKAAAALLRNVLFFAVDPEYVRMVFEAACQVASSIPVYRLTFLPTAEVWEMIS
jgi:hypothetical protein